ncbi:phosphotransferase enzyme family protein [Kineococcus sp. SYSU DK003]|uniref:phosphotransferase enzyme family protein n=1 Tax=Kineococcus sp. SYSU DK003 TaxID=3383124 RepID=UPI003D7C4A3E
MNSTAAAPPFAVFDTLRRGDAAPEWIRTPVLDAWGLSPAAHLTLIAVSENATFRISVDGAPVAVLRLHRPGYVADPAQIAAELTWMRAIAADTDVRVPEVLPLRDGTLVHEFTDPDGTTWFAVAFGFVVGEVLEATLAAGGLDVGALRSCYAEIGATTAALHEHVTGWVAPTGFARFGWDLDEALGASSRWGDWRGASLSGEHLAVCERAELAARDVLATATPTGLVHADLRPSNIMVDAAGRLTVIDFDDCGTSRLLWDFAAALSFIEHEEFVPTIASAWIAGYRTVRELSETDLQVAAALSVVRRLQMLGWTTTHRQDALPPAVWAAQVPGTVEVGRRYLDRPLWLFEGGTR